MKNQDQHKTPEQQQHDQQDHPAGYFAKIGSKFIGRRIFHTQSLFGHSNVYTGCHKSPLQTTLNEEYTALQAEIKAGAMWWLSEAEKTLAFIQETTGKAPFILMGDFNAENH